jgi:hypothetical protein
MNSTEEEHEMEENRVAAILKFLLATVCVTMLLADAVAFFWIQRFRRTARLSIIIKSACWRATRE